MSHHDVTVIRPLINAPEREVAGTARKLELPVLKSACPEDGHTNRETVRQFILEKEREDRRFQDKITGALRRAGISRW
jgi:tRNA(Ile)-lysidine synthase TilS/MesJ